MWKLEAVSIYSKGLSEAGLDGGWKGGWRGVLQRIFIAQVFHTQIGLH